MTEVNIPEIEATMSTPTHLSYEDWIERWTSHLGRTNVVIRVPSTATAVVTPLKTQNWQSCLVSHPNQKLTSFFISDLTHGFRIGYNSQKSLKSAKRNLSCALEHQDMVNQYLTDELAHRRVAGPYHINWAPHMHISRFGVIPKHHQPNKWRLIIDLSHSPNHSVNDGIPTSLCSLVYITIDSVISDVLKLGQGTLLAKIDIINTLLDCFQSTLPIAIC